MLNQLSRATRAVSAVATFSRVARVSAVQTRCFIAPTVSRRADYVQELYLKELKASKLAIFKDFDARGQVQEFQMPKTPASPEEADIASNLKEYQNMAVEIEGQDAVQSQGGAAVLPDWLEAEEDDEAGH